MLFGVLERKEKRRESERIFEGIMAEFSQNLEGDLNIQCEDLSKSQMAKIQPNPCQDTSSLEIRKDKKDLKVRKMPHGLCGLSSESVNRFLI